MSIRNSEEYKCKCGNVGKIKTTENDQPYSEPWFRYTFEGLQIGPQGIQPNNKFEVDIKLLDLHCSVCGQKIIISK